ncbi:hypothetical protein [Pseudoduganella sp. GCM10020061]|uniref:hypothetical protein n=1 Tax=Pseudoduganella sp. GCM10020061 TaxID=3317345 RepID=UPI003632531E
MRERITKLEAFAADAMKRFDGIDARFDRVEARLDTLSQQLHDYRIETKHDIDNAVRWIVGVILAVSMAAITIVTFVLNHATPRTMPPAQQLQPIIIYASVPSGTQARSTAPAQP